MEKKFNPMAKVYQHLTISLVFMFMGVLIGQQFIPPALVYYANQIMMVGGVALLLFCLLSKKNIIPIRFSMGFVYLFTFINGILLYPILMMYLSDLGPSIVRYVLIGTISIFTVCSVTASKKEPGHYVGLGKTLFNLLLVLLLFTIVGFFISNDVYHAFISAASIVIFTGYLLVDISFLRKRLEMDDVRDSKDLSFHVLNLYLDFINIFLDLLRLIARLKD